MSEPVAAETTFRVLISGSDDVGPERQVAEAMLAEVGRGLGGRVAFVVVGAADGAPMFDSDAAGGVDLVISLLWKGLGETLPARFDRPDGSPRTAVEYEFETALAAALERQTPDILVYRKRVVVDVEQAEAARAELRALNAFWQKWFRNEQGHFTASFDGFDTTEELAAKLRSHLQQWLLRRRAEVTWPVEIKGSPYRSLEPFDATHAGVFFGRSLAIRQVVSKVAAAAARGCAFLVVLGASGSGKSSLVRAGVIPWLVERRIVPDIAEWRSAVVRPALLGEDALLGLANALFAEGALPELVRSDYHTPEQLAAVAARSPEAAAILVSGALRTLHPARESRLVLLVDQLEELLGRSPDTATGVLAMLDALARGARVWVLATVRSDRYPEFQSFPQLLKLKADGASFDLLPPDRAEIREIIEGPARAAGLRLEEASDRSLAAMLEADSMERGALPLLQFTLQRLFTERFVAEGTMLLSVYDRLGGLAGAIATEAERTVEGLGDALKAALPRLLINLVDIQPGNQFASARTQRRDDVRDPDARSLADALVSSRFLTLEGSGDAATLRLAHEALLTRWPQLADLIADQRAFLTARSRLRSDAQLWRANAGHADFLLPAGRRLIEAGEALAHHRADLEPQTIAFLEASQAAEQARAAARAEDERHALEERARVAETRALAARRLVQRTRIAAVLVSILLVGMIAAAGLWLSQWQLAKARATEAEKNYGTAIKAASDAVNVVAAARQFGQLPNDIATKLLDGTRQTFEQLHGANEASTVTASKVELYSQIAQAAYLSGKLSEARAPLDTVLALASQLVSREPGNDQWQSDLIHAHEMLGQYWEQAGSLPQADREYAAMLSLAEQMVARERTNLLWQGWRLEAISHRGDTLRARGDLPSATARYREALAGFTKGDAANPSILTHYLVATTDLALSRALASEGDVAAALDHAQQALVAFEKLSEQQKSNHNWQFAAALSNSMVGDFERLAGDLDKATDAFKAAISIETALGDADKTNFLMRNNFAASRRGMADVALMQGDTHTALELYRLVLGTIKTLAENDPENSFWQGNLAVMHVRVGDAIADSRDPAAEEEYRDGLAVATRLTNLDPTNADWQRALSIAHARLGDLLRGRNALAEATTEEKAALVISDRLAKLDPADVAWRRDLGGVEGRLGVLYAAQDDKTDARRAYEACAAIPKPAIDRDLLYNRPEDMHDQCVTALSGAK